MRLTWDDIDDMIDDIVKWIREKVGDGVYHYTILAVVRGGLIPGVMLSHRFDNVQFQTIPIQRYNHGLNASETKELAKEMFEKHNIQEPYIVVDDINDMGITLEAIRSQLKSHNYYITLVERTTSTFKTSFAAKIVEHKEWVDFPWGDDRARRENIRR